MNAAIPDSLERRPSENDLFAELDRQWERDAEARAAMRRCARCVLPESMPFIEFDADGVCNYCRSYTPMTRLGMDALETALAPYRKGGKDPDCLVAFSGGRDSSYGLHLLVRELGMKPLAFTFDWGMVTDIGHRNRKRMCSALGVENLVITADIPRQIRHIRDNINAWLGAPNLGMVPLFMAGDKLFFRHANRLVRERGIPIMVFCSNKLEKTDFKTGFCGISPQREANQPFTINLQRKLRLLGFYAGQFIRNPGYLNGSLFNSFNSFVSFYFQEGKYLYLYDYAPWKEAAVNSVLLGDYGWETAPDSPSTWRIGDATAPLYNFIYLTAAGFSEFDTFRSNQIREGMLDRDVALAALEMENRPRWAALEEYCRTVGVDMRRLTQTVNAMPKLYSEKG